jgi:hypothetical protein
MTHEAHYFIPHVYPYLLHQIIKLLFAITIPTLILLLHPLNNNLSIMEMLEFIMIDLAILLAIKMNQFTCNVFKKTFHNNVWAKSFWKELFQSPLIMVAIIYHDKLPFWNFDGFIFLSIFFFCLAWANSITCHVCNWLSSNSTNSNFFCFAILPLPTNVVLLCEMSLLHT